MFTKKEIAFLNSLARALDSESKYLDSDGPVLLSKTITDGEWYWRAENKKKIIQRADKPKRNWANVLSSHPQISTGIRIRRALNGFVIIDHNSSSAIKTLHKTREPNFILNELLANKYYPNISNPVAARFELDGFNVCVSKLLPDRHRMKEIEIEKVIQMLFVPGQDTSKIRLSEYKEQVISEIASFGHPSKTLRATAIRILHKFEGKFQEELSKNQNLELIMKHSHGDLVPNNIFGIASPTLIDWTNGGNHLFTYDLVVPEIYKPRGEFWAAISLGAWSNSVRAEVCNSYYSSVSGLKMTTNTFRSHILINLLEFFSKNYRRHQQPSDITEGEKVLGLIDQIIEKAKPSWSQE